jgi:hypothetical protein
MADFQRKSVELRALVNGAYANYLRVLSVDTSLGGAHRLDHAEVILDLGHPEVRKLISGLSIANLRIDTGIGLINVHGAECAIFGKVDGKDVIYHWGKLSLSELSIGNEEGILLSSRILPQHFGRPLPYMLVYDPRSRTNVRLDHDPIFNPEVKGKVFGNRRVPAGQADTYPIFIDFGSTRTAAACNYQQVLEQPLADAERIAERSSEYWTLLDAVLYLCHECNPDVAGQLIANPTRNELLQVLPVRAPTLTAADRGVLRNHIVRAGQYLPEALEQLLEPYGFSFRIEYTGFFNRKIRIVRDGVGPRKQVKHQAPGRVLDTAQTECERVDLVCDYSRAVNQVRASGYLTQVEATVELKPAWDAQYDDLPMSSLIRSGPDWATHPEYHRVWRDWVIDLAGEYRRDWSNLGTSPYDLTPLFRAVFPGHPVLVPRRRRLLPMLTLAEDGQPYGSIGGVHVEWYNPNKTGGAGWDSLWQGNATFACHLLRGEAGIRFTGEVPPVFIRNLASAARVRVTATFESDSRLTYLAPRRPSSVNPLVHESHLDVNRRFHFRQLHPDSTFYARVQNGTLKADLADGRLSLADFCQQAQNAWDQAEISGSITLEGLDRQNVKLGDLVTRIVGRNIDLETTRLGGSVESKYPQVVGVRYDAQQQTTHLTLSGHKETDALLGSLLYKARRLK